MINFLLLTNKVWSIKSLQRLYTIYSTYDIGDIFCVAYSSSLNTVYLGCQNASIQVCYQSSWSVSDESSGIVSTKKKTAAHIPPCTQVIEKTNSLTRLDRAVSGLLDQNTLNHQMAMGWVTI
jgi:hypothetical protein